MDKTQFKLAERKQFRGDLSNMMNVVNDYINIDRQDFLQSAYTEFSPDEDWLKHYAKKEGEFCAIGWLAIAKDIDLPSFTHNLEPTGYVYKGKQMQSKYGTDENGDMIKVGEKEVVHEVHERACECELHTQQDDEDRETWVEDDYLDFGVTYADTEHIPVPEVDDDISNNTYKEYFLKSTLDLESVSSRAYVDTKRFVKDLLLNYRVPNAILEDIQLINDNPTFTRLHSMLGDCGSDYAYDESFAVSEDMYGKRSGQCIHLFTETNPVSSCINGSSYGYLKDKKIGSWKKNVVDYLKNTQSFAWADETEFEKMMDCNYQANAVNSIDMVKAYLNLLLTNDDYADFYLRGEMRTELDDEISGT
jgi:hypothetical protein|tara:strand:+ start:2225 stop:3310 length:1086 start_codon:yes stop_codon:yes gene_type:complete